MITEIAEHSIWFEALPENAHILDLGCRGFAFGKEMISRGHDVVMVDIDPSLQGEIYFSVAISDYDGECGLIETSDKQATRIDKSAKGIKCFTLASFSKQVGVEFWDLIKMDVEGSEFEIIMSLDKAPAKQLSVEFHLHTGIYGQHEMTLMENKLKALGYVVISHDYEARHCAGFNYWDSLFVLKGIA